MYSDTGQVTIPVNYTDSEGVSGTKTLTATISKAKAAAPTTLALLSSETQTMAGKLGQAFYMILIKNRTSIQLMRVLKWYPDFLENMH